MRNILLLVEYDGTEFAGWQVQPRKRTVQGILEKVLAGITRERVHVAGASRTDAGVHALGQAANFRTRSEIPCRRFLNALNGLLPPDLSVQVVREVSPGFHAVRSAKKKRYHYRIWNDPVRPALLRDRVWHVWEPLDLRAMRKGARCLMGRHDFSAFRGTRSDTKTSVRRIERIRVLRIGGGKEVAIEITADGFLKYMVRNIVGSLVDVGRGKSRPEEVERILESRDRKKAGRTAPACGLTLVKIDY